MQIRVYLLYKYMHIRVYCTNICIYRTRIKCKYIYAYTVREYCSHFFYIKLLLLLEVPYRVILILFEFTGRYYNMILTPYCFPPLKKNGKDVQFRKNFRMTPFSMSCLPSICIHRGVMTPHCMQFPNIPFFDS